MSFTVTVDDAELRRAAMAAPARIQGELRQAVELSLVDFEGAVVSHTPVGATGHLRQSITHDISGSGISMVGRVFSQDKPIKVAAVETGRRPGAPPPISAILPWVQRKLGGDRQVAFLVARAIGRRGTKGAFMFQKGFAEARPIVDRRIAAFLRSLRSIL